ATPGPLGFYLGEPNNGPPTLGMVTYPLPFARYRRFFTEGVTLAVIGRHEVRAEDILTPMAKHRSRILWHVADHKARDRTGNPAALALPLGTGCGLTETSVANILAVIDGALTSPPRATILDGISLRVTRELCLKHRIAFLDGHLWDLSDTSEAMLTGTGFCIAGVREVFTSAREPHRFEWPGPVFKKLLAAWSDLVGVDIEKQFTQGA